MKNVNCNLLKPKVMYCYNCLFCQPNIHKPRYSMFYHIRLNKQHITAIEMLELGIFKLKRKWLLIYQNSWNSFFCVLTKCFSFKIWHYYFSKLINHAACHIKCPKILWTLLTNFQSQNSKVFSKVIKVACIEFCLSASTNTNVLCVARSI